MIISSDEGADTQGWQASSQHDVQFYESDDFLAERVGAFIGAGLGAGDGAIVIATKEHRKQIERRLDAEGARPSAARLERRYVALDADETLARFMVDGSPDPKRFARVIGRLIRATAQRAGQTPRHVWVFGEMVALLWQEGNPGAAIRLEELWNELQDAHDPFSLCCAYPMRAFAGEEQRNAFIAICERHGRAIPAESYATLATPAERERAITLLQQRASSLEAEIAERRQIEAQLREMEARKDAFIVMASHELKTPVTSLKAFTQILQRRLASQTDPRTLAMLVRMETQLERLISLIGDLLDVSRMQSGILTYRDSSFDFDAMVRETVRDMQAVATAHTIQMEGESGTRVYGDRDRLSQALANLVANAIKYSPDAPTIFVRLGNIAEPGGGLVEVAVRDHGVGIAERHQAHIFERFYQADDERGGTYAGLGIGLFVAHQFVERHGGRLWVESREGEGSTFHMVLPCVRGEMMASPVEKAREGVS